MQELLSKHMIGTFAIEIAALTVALSIIGFIAMRLRAKKTGRVHGVRQYLLTASFALFLASILSLTLTPIGGANSVTNPELYYPRFYVGWSWQQAWELTAGMGLNRFATTVYAQLFFNVAMFIPLGFFTAGCLRWGLRATALSGFALSSFIELSQLTGNWGLAGFTYRTFDVDDIVNNTAGAVFGAVCIWVVRAIQKRRAAKHDRVLEMANAAA
ncbi:MULTISPECIES: VanZ family protein [unclassified Rothia (in: high G+C Gram-positive bacteria)]|uniref:VanZ family protein n=1 Tax=unclassified Rothia (in: high G+C Gram-positive bacteria) TaxID=2689056 RepID=UPI00244BA83B|nr:MULTISPECIES: VanZ family protein [unclassified Rothia (in: high G+C Gram-positive bacteria)]